MENMEQESYTGLHVPFTLTKQTNSGTRAHQTLTQPTDSQTATAASSLKDFGAARCEFSPLLWRFVGIVTHHLRWAEEGPVDAYHYGLLQPLTIWSHLRFMWHHLVAISDLEPE